MHDLPTANGITIGNYLLIRLSSSQSKFDLLS